MASVLFGPPSLDAQSADALRDSIASLSRFDLKGATKDPAQLGALLDLTAILKDLEPRMQEAAVTLGLQGKKIPGWSVVRRDGNRFVDGSHVRDLILECPANRLPGLLEAVSKAIGGVSESRWKSLCEIAGKDGVGTVSQAGAKAFLRRRSPEEKQQPNERS